MQVESGSSLHLPGSPGEAEVQRETGPQVRWLQGEAGPVGQLRGCPALGSPRENGGRGAAEPSHKDSQGTTPPPDSTATALVSLHQSHEQAQVSGAEPRAP